MPVVSKLSRLRPAEIALRNHAGRGPRPPQVLPCPSLYFAAADPFERDDAEPWRRADADVELAKRRSSAVNP